MTAGKFWAFLWKLGTAPILGIIYWIVIAEGLRLLVPALGIPLHKLPIPGCSYLRWYQSVNKLDLANVMAVFLFIAVWYLWLVILKIWLHGDSYFFLKGVDPVTYTKMVFVLGFMILGSDGLLFYYAMTNQSWVNAGSWFSLPALLITVAYIGVVVFVSFVSANLEAGGAKENAL